MQNQVNEEIAGAGFEYQFKAVKSSGAWADSEHDFLLFDLAVYEAGLEAENEGMDAVCIGTVTDSGLSALRSRLTIPVVGPGQVQFHIAALQGSTFSVLTMWDRWIPIYEKNARDYGMIDRLASIRHIDKRPDFENLLSGYEDKVFPRLREEGMKAIEEDGADVICMGSTTMQQAVPFLREELPVPVLNPGPLSFKMAELFVTLGYNHSKAAYPEPEVPMDRKIHAMLEAVSEGYSEYRDAPS